MIAETWLARSAGVLTVYCQAGSYAEDHLDEITAQYDKALRGVCAALGVDPAALPPISVHLSPFLEPGTNGRELSATTRVDFDRNAIWTVVSSESPGDNPEFALTHLVLERAFGPGLPEARFWADGLAGYLAGRSGASYYAEAVERAKKMREEGQLRPLVNVVRQYAERRSAAATTIAAAFVTYLIDWRGAERYRRFLTAARAPNGDAFTRAYGRPLPGVDQTWVRRMEATAQAGGGKTLIAIRGVLPLLRPYALQVAGILVTIILGLSFDVFMPLAIRFIIDHILTQRPTGFAIPFLGPAGTRIERADQDNVLYGLAALMVFMFLLNAVARIRQTSMTASVSQGINFNLRMRMLEHIQRLPIAYHSRTPATEVTQRFFTDIAYVPAAFSGGIVPIVQSGLAILIFSFTMFSLNPWLSLVALTGLPGFAFAARTGRATIRDNQRETARRSQEIQQSIVENMNAQVLLKTWNARPTVMERFREKLAINRELNVRNMVITSAFGRASTLITNAAQVALLVIGGLIVIYSGGQDLTPGGLFAFYALLLRLYAPAGTFAGALQTLSLSADGLERLGKVMERDEEADPPNPAPIGPLRDAVRFEGVSFAQVKGKNLLKGFNAEIRAGTTTAFVGPTGSGKASLLQILPRLYDATEGSVTWDGTDIRAARRDAVRAQIITLSQDTFIFSTTIYENILIGCHVAAESDVVAAAIRVGLHDAILALPNGYDTVVGDRDTTLSTPQRQRLAAARALLRTDASVVLMEDALSAVEAADQREIEQALRGPRGSRTLIKVAQRLTAVTDADEIFVVDNGAVVEHGTHDELLDRGGIYTQMIRDELGEAAVSGARQAARRLSKLGPFASLPPEVLEETARLLLYAERRAGEVICRQGTMGDELYIIGRGHVEIVVEDEEQGEERIVNVLGEGDYVGEISFIRRTPRTATVRAQDKVELHVLQRLDFDALLERLGAGTVAQLEHTAQERIEDTRRKLAILASARSTVTVTGPSGISGPGAAVVKDESREARVGHADG